MSASSRLLHTSMIAYLVPNWWPLTSGGPLACSGCRQPHPDRAGFDPECLRPVRESGHRLANKLLLWSPGFKLNLYYRSWSRSHDPRIVDASPELGLRVFSAGIGHRQMHDPRTSRGRTLARDPATVVGFRNLRVCEVLGINLLLLHC